jgi:hypothetical protein
MLPKSWCYKNTDRFRVFENRVLRRTFGPKRDEVIREGRIPNNEKLYALYCSPNIIQVINFKNKMGRARSTYGWCIQDFGET